MTIEEFDKIILTFAQDRLDLMHATLKRMGSVCSEEELDKIEQMLWIGYQIQIRNFCPQLTKEEIRSYTLEAAIKERINILI